MYNPNQVVWSFDLKAPVQIGNDVWDTKNYPKGRTTHFIDADGKAVCPKSIKQAKLLLERNRIVPAPVSESHCWSCFTWLSHKPKEECKAQDEHYKCDRCGEFNTHGSRNRKLLCGKCWDATEHSELLVIAKKLVETLEASKDTHKAHNIMSELRDFSMYNGK